MNEQAARVQIVINTLETLNIPAAYDNVNRLTGIYNLLYQLRDELAAMKAGDKEADNGSDAAAE